MTDPRIDRRSFLAGLFAFGAVLRLSQPVAKSTPAQIDDAWEDLLKDPQLNAVGFFREREHPTEGRFFDLRPAAKFSARPDPEIGLPPQLGEHNEEVEAELRRGE